MRIIIFSIKNSVKKSSLQRYTYFRVKAHENTWLLLCRMKGDVSPLVDVLIGIFAAAGLIASLSWCVGDSDKKSKR